jgi:hypothetical protein
MRWVEKVQTSDGQLHDHERRALDHAEKRYGDALTALAHRLVRVEKYTAMCDFLDANIAEFVALEALKADCIMERDEPNGIGL